MDKINLPSEGPLYKNLKEKCEGMGGGERMWWLRGRSGKVNMKSWSWGIPPLAAGLEMRSNPEIASQNVESNDSVNRLMYESTGGNRTGNFQATNLKLATRNWRSKIGNSLWSNNPPTIPTTTTTTIQ